jgi:hypothetical protein
MTLDTLIALLTYIVLVSGTTERAVQVLKSIPFTKLATASASTVQAVAVGVGCILAYFTSSPELVKVVGNQNAAIIMTGFLSSAGAGAWHDMLSILQNFKTGKV